MLDEFPATRLRRVRRQAALREMVRETRITPANLVYPLFITDTLGPPQPVFSMPGCYRWNLDHLRREVGAAMALGIRTVALFPQIGDSLKTPLGEAALDEGGLVPRAIRLLKAEFPGLVVVADVALDPYSSHGQDGVLDANQEVDNDKTVRLLVKQALLYAAAGADAVAPSDMMDGRVGRIRSALESEGHHHTLIVSYAAKYASRLYGPFREAIGSAASLGNASKSGYQMDPANQEEGVREALLDLREGADIIMVKPGGFYLDVLSAIRGACACPLWAYQVSGEYAMLRLALDKGLLPPSVLLEVALCFRRAGAVGLVTYFAKQMAQLLQEEL